MELLFISSFLLSVPLRPSTFSMNAVLPLYFGAFAEWGENMLKPIAHVIDAVDFEGYMTSLHRSHGPRNGTVTSEIDEARTRDERMSLIRSRTTTTGDLADEEHHSR